MREVSQPWIRKGAVPDDGFIVHLHDAVGVAAARAARQKGKGQGWLAARWGPGWVRPEGRG